MAELIERIAFEAREDKRVDRRSGVSQRLPISVLDNVVSNAERRTIVTKEKTVVPRISDVYAALPAITGKLELEYEGELQGSETIAKDLIRRAAGRTFEGRVGGANVDDIVHWFDEGGALKITPEERSEALLKGFTVVPGLLDLIDQVGLAGKKDPATMVSACELPRGSSPRSASRAARSSHARARSRNRRSEGTRRAWNRAEPVHVSLISFTYGSRHGRASLWFRTPRGCLLPPSRRRHGAW
jgi:magnesium chelatase subunit I